MEPSAKPINLLERLSSLAWVLPYYGHAEEGYLLLSFLSKKTHRLLSDNEVAILGMILKRNKRSVSLDSKLGLVTNISLKLLVKLFKVSAYFRSCKDWHLFVSTLHEVCLQPLGVEMIELGSFRFGVGESQTDYWKNLFLFVITWNFISINGIMKDQDRHAENEHEFLLLSKSNFVEASTQQIRWFVNRPVPLSWVERFLVSTDASVFQKAEGLMKTWTFVPAGMKSWTKQTDHFLKALSKIEIDSDFEQQSGLVQEVAIKICENSRVIDYHVFSEKYCIQTVLKQLRVRKEQLTHFRVYFDDPLPVLWHRVLKDLCEYKIQNFDIRFDDVTIMNPWFKTKSGTICCYNSKLNKWNGYKFKALCIVDYQNLYKTEHFDSNIKWIEEGSYSYIALNAVFNVEIKGLKQITAHDMKLSKDINASEYLKSLIPSIFTDFLEANKDDKSIESWMFIRFDHKTFSSKRNLTNDESSIEFLDSSITLDYTWTKTTNDFALRFKEVSIKWNEILPYRNFRMDPEFDKSFATNMSCNLTSLKIFSFQWNTICILNRVFTDFNFSTIQTLTITSPDLIKLEEGQTVAEWAADNEDLQTLAWVCRNSRRLTRIEEKASFVNTVQTDKGEKNSYKMHKVCLLRSPFSTKFYVLF